MGQISTMPYNLPNNYIYLYHTNELYLLPAYPVESITDGQGVTYSQETPLARSAPIYSFTSSGPRTIQFSFKLHREWMQKFNDNSNTYTTKEDYIDDLVKGIQASVLPNYGSSSKMVDPPMVAVRIDNQIFIKGVITSGLTLTYEKPIMSDGRYAVISFSFTVSEVDPWDAELVKYAGSYRPSMNGDEIRMNTTLTTGSLYRNFVKE